MKTFLKKIQTNAMRTALAIGAIGLMGFSANSFASGGPEVPLQKAPKNASDLVAVQDGARTFVNYCLNCHGASALRYNQLKEIGLSEAQIKNNLLFASEKTGDLMNIAMKPEDARKWFGGVPPDLSLVARSRGVDWLYTYMRSFYKDDSRTTGWNNTLFPNVGMPHILWEWQGTNHAKFIEEKDPHHEEKMIQKFAGFENVTPGVLKPIAYDEKIANLVAFLDWMAEPKQNDRKRTGMWVLFYLGIFTILAWRLNANFWKDIKA